MPNKFFEEISAPWEGAVIFLDVDGTLRPDGGEGFEQKVSEKLEGLKAKNTVYLVSNKTGAAKKPGRKVADGVDLKDKQVIVIGDKFLTDGLFAKNIGAEFIKVKRKISGQEPFLVKITYLIDDFVSAILWNQKNI